MSVLEIVVTIIGIGGTASSIIFAYLAFRRNDKKDSKDVGEDKGRISSDLGHIKSSVERIERRMDVSDERYAKMIAQITKVEESVTYAHKRIDEINNKKRSKTNE
jgi:peptidoglycan hydrolase CwlO-like protein